MSITYGLNANYTDIDDGKIVVKKLEATKQTKDQNNNKIKY